MVSIDLIDSHIAVYFRVTPSARKFDSPANRSAVAKRMASFGVVPSETGVFRALNELIDEGAINRVDGGSDKNDVEASRAAEQSRLDRIAAQPLTERDFDSFVRLMPAELERKYYSDSEFRVRYDRACKDWGFRKPAPSRPNASGRAFV